MKTLKSKWQYWWLAMMMVTALAAMVYADNPCTESGPHYGTWYCYQPGTLKTAGILNYTNLTVSPGSVIIPPSWLTLPVFNNGSEQRSAWYDCNTWLNGVQAAPVFYVPGSPYFTPSMPGSTNTPGIYAFTAKVDAAPSSIAGWWPGEGNVQDVVFGHNGTLKNGAGFAYGKVGRAFNFNGSGSYIEITNSTSVSPAGPFAVEAWVNYNGLTGGSGVGIMAKGRDVEGAIDWALNISSVRKLRPHVQLNGGWYNFDCSTVLNPGTWYHVAMVYDGYYLRGYVNGVQDGVMAIGSGQVAVSTNSLRIGAYAPLNGTVSKCLFSGLIDEVSIYSCSLSAAQILAIYNAGSAGKNWNGSTNGAALPSGCVCSGVSNVTIGAVSVIVTCPPPVLTNQPANQVVAAGSNVVFAVGATGTAPLSYQWRYNGANISGATASNFTTNNVSLNSAGLYSVVVTNAGGSVTSLGAALTVVGVSNVIVDGSNPEVAGAATVVVGSQFVLRAKPNPVAADFPSGCPTWTIVTQPSGSSLSAPPAGFATATNTPVVAGQYVIWAVCGNSSNSFAIKVVDTNDLDYNGIPDNRELTTPSQTQLSSFRFDTPDWIGLQGQRPASFTNLLLKLGWYVGALEVNSNSGPAWLAYSEINTNTGVANINCRQGSLRFMFRPNWSSTNSGGVGPKNEATLLEMGSKGTTNGCWGLYIDGAGTNLYFCTQTNSGSTTVTTNFSTGIKWASGTDKTNWHQVVLTYSTTNSLLFLDGQPVATNGVGVSAWPGSTVRSQGFHIGSTTSGTNWAQGRFDNLETFNYVMSSSVVSNFYNSHPQPERMTNFCNLAPIGINFQQAQGMTNGQIVTAYIGTQNGNSTWLDWNGGSGSSPELASMLNDLSSVSGYINPAPTNHADTLVTEDWIYANSGVNNSSDVKAALDQYTNSPTTLNPITIGIVLWDDYTTDYGDAYRAAGFANIALISYDLTGSAYIQYKYLGVRSCNAYYPNVLPKITIVSPSDLQTTTVWNTNLSATLSITAAAFDPEDGLTNIAFYSSTNANYLGSCIYYQAITNANTNLYTYNWTGAPHGTNYLTAIALDEFGGSCTSSVIRSIVNWPPTISGITNRTIVWDENSSTTNITLNGSVSDDGLPSGTTNITWSLTSSNGVVAFGAANQAVTMATFYTNGIYGLRLAASDGAATVSSNCSITILRRPFISITSPTSNTVLNSGTSIAINATAYDLDGVVTNVQFFNWTTNLLGTIAGESGPYIQTWTPSTNGVYALTAVATDNNGLTTTSTVVTVVMNIAPTVSAGPGQIITLPVTNVTLAGTVTDDGLPQGSSLTSIWSVVSSNGPVTFGNVNATNSTVSFTTNGLYVLKLTANDTVGTNSSSVCVTVNQTPQVNAGTNLIVTLGGSSVVASLTGSFSDDGLPVGATVTARWSVVSATNGNVSIANTNLASTTATFTNSGNYVLKLTVNDTVSTNSSNVTITVNRGPTVNAGTNLKLVWDEAASSISTNLTGSASDDGFPYGILTNLWSKISGPGTVAFAPATNASTTVTFSTNGTYALQLTANDGRLSSSSQCLVTILRRPFVVINQPTNNATYGAGSAITNIASAFDLDGVVTNILFCFNGTNFGTGIPVPTPVVPVSGRVGFWRGEGNAYDSVGTNNGTVQGATSFVAGKVGQAFAFNNTNATVAIPASASLNVGTSNGFTLEAWINPTDVTQAHPLFEWNSSTWWGVHFYIAPGQPTYGSAGPAGPGQLYANIVDSSGGWHQMGSSAGVIASNVFQHVALTYDKASGIAKIYCNGQIVSQATLGSFTPQTSYNLYLGQRPAPADQLTGYAGLIDEPSLYNRALATNEIQAIYNAGTNNQFMFVWTNAPSGTNTIYAVATDNDGLTKTSSPPVTVYVSSAGSPVTVSITSPTNGQMYITSPTNILLTASATTSAGTITNVQFFNGAILLGNAGFTTNTTYTLLWTNVPAGNYSLTAVARNSLGNSNTSAVVAITVNAMPLAGIVSPTNLQTYLEVTNITISVSASDADGTISQVKFYYFTNLLGTVTSTGANGYYNFTWSNLVASVYPVVAVAMDNRGAATETPIRVFRVNPTNPPPSVAIIIPTNNAVFADGSDITITATATANVVNGWITNVEFLVDGNSIGSIQTPPYNITQCCWKPGKYTMTAKATDNLGSSTVSSNVVITVAKERLAAEGYWDPLFARILTTNTVSYYTSQYGLGNSVAVNSDGIFFGTGDVSRFGGGGWWGWYSGYYGGYQYYPLSEFAYDNTNAFGLVLSNLTAYADYPDASVIGRWDAIKIDGTNIYVGGGDGGYYYYSYGTAYPWLDVVKLAGTNWQAVTTNSWFSDASTNNPLWLPKVTAIETLGGDLYVAGTFIDVATNNTPEDYDTNVQFVAKLDKANNRWVSVATNNLNDPVLVLTVMGGHLYAGGQFTAAGNNTNVVGVARLDGNCWTNLGSGVRGPGVAWTNADTGESGYSNSITFVTSLSACGSDLYVGGRFTTAGGNTNASGVAIWDGAGWRTMGGGPSAYGYEEVYAYPGHPGARTGNYSIDPWQSLDQFSLPAVMSLKAHGTKVFVGGIFSYIIQGSKQIAAQNIAQATWSENSQSWSWSDLDIGTAVACGGVGAVQSLAIREGQTPDTYDLLVGGGFLFVGSASMASPGYALWHVGPMPPGAPVVIITNPPGFTVYTNPDSIHIDATAVSNYTNIDSSTVAFFYDGTPITSGVTDNGDGSFSIDWWIGGSGLSGLHALTASATDAAGLQGKSRPVFINILDTNIVNTVTAVDDQFVVLGNYGDNPPVTFDVLTNDSTSTGNKLQIIGVYPVAGTKGIVNPSFDGGSVIYQPPSDFYGNDVFMYAVTDGTDTNTAYVSVTIRIRPGIFIQHPSDGQIIGATTNITFTGAALDYDTTITSISVYVNGALAYQTVPANLNYISNPTNFFFDWSPGAVSPQTSYAWFSFNWSTNKAGFYTFAARATDNYGFTNLYTFDSSLSLNGQTPPVNIIVTNDSTGTNILTASIANLPITVNSMFGTQVYTVVSDGLFDLQGTAWDSNIGDAVSYQVLLHPVGDPYTVVANVTPQPRAVNGFHQGSVNNGDLGICDFSLVPNGVYDIELLVRGGGAETSYTTTFQLESQLKIGQFGFSEQDLALPVNGIPITITRTYNSLNPLSSDFGYSWSFAINSMDVQLDEERTSAKALDTVDGEPASSYDFSMRVGGGRDVTLTLPDGRRTTFIFNIIPTLSPDNDSGALYDAQWIAPPGVKATLTTPNPTTKNGQGDNTLYIPFGDSKDVYWMAPGSYAFQTPMDGYDFPELVLTTQDGTKFVITRDTPGEEIPTYIYQDSDNYFGQADKNYFIQPHSGKPKLTKIIERSGDTIQITDNGIFHYNAMNALTRSASFTRDAQGRITAIYDPNSGTNGLPALKYVYNRETGNLIQVLKLVDRIAGSYLTNKYSYDNANFPHYITSIENSDGVPVTRNEYDDNGRISAMTDADGNRTVFIHSLTNKIEMVIDRLGNTNVSVYDTRGNVVAATNALSQIKLMAYDDNNNKTNEIAFINGQPYATNCYIYSNDNLLLASYDPLGRSNIFTYNSFGQVLTSLAPCGCGYGVVNNYDSDGNLTITIDALGKATTNFYDNGLLVGSRSVVGTITTNYYDDSGDLIASAAFAGSIILSTNSFVNDDNGNLIQETAWRQINGVWTGATTTHSYDARNRIVQTIDPDGGTNFFVYNPIDKLQMIVDKLGRTTSYEYDAKSQLIKTVYPDLTTEMFYYDSEGRRTNKVDRAGRSTVHIYDAVGHLTQTIYPDNTTSRTIYDDLGRERFFVDARNVTNALGYDVAGQNIAVTNGLGTIVQLVSTYGYDLNGNQICFTNALGRATINIYDAENRLLEVHDSDGGWTSTGYDGLGRRVAVTNRDGIVTRFGYLGDELLISVTNAWGKPEQTVARYDYDEAGNLLHQIDALNRTNSFTYDLINRCIRHVSPGNQTESFAYDSAGNLIYQTNFNGAVITNQYDALNRLTNRSSVNGYNVAWAYSPAGQRTNMADSSGVTDYYYDARDRLLKKSVNWRGGPTISLNYRYDLNGNLTNLWSSTVNGATNIYQYDSLSRLTNVIGQNNVMAGYIFDGVGNLQSVRYGNGVTNFYRYDSLNRLTNLLWKSSGTTIASFDYTLLLSGTRAGLNENLNGSSRTYTWQYNNLYRLTNENIGAIGTVTYGYDQVGNRTNRTSGISGIANQIFSFNTNDWLASDSCDSNGSTISSSGNTYKYDVLNHVTNVNDGAILIEYDGDGNRVKKTVGTTTTYYLLEDRNPSGYVQVLEEHQSISGGTTTLNTLYTYGLDLIAQQRSGGVRYFSYDGHGSTRLLTDTNNAVTDTYLYDSYGDKLSGSTGTTLNNYLYCGQQWDSDLGFYYLRARYLNPNTGRFQTADTFEGNQEDPASLHKYLYADDNPVNMVDPSGLTSDAEELAVTGIEGIVQQMKTVAVQMGSNKAKKIIGCNLGKELAVEGVYIYMIETLEGGVVYYVGQSVNVEMRLAQWARKFRNGFMSSAVSVRLVGVIKVVPGVTEPKARKFVREFVEKTFIKTFESAAVGQRLNLLNRIKDPVANLGERAKKYLKGGVRKGIKAAANVTGICKKEIALGDTIFKFPD